MRGLLIAATALLTLVAGRPSNITKTGNTDAERFRVLQTFENGDFLENIITTSAGSLLLTSFSDGNLYSLDPDAEEPQIRTVATLPNVTALSGLQEVSPGVILVSGGLLENLSFQQGSIKIFRVEISASKSDAKVTVLAHVVNRTMLNGMTTVPGDPNIILSADSIAGEVVRFDLRTGVSDVAISDPLFRLVPDTVPLGINGIEASGGYLYFTNSARGLFGRIKIDMFGNRQRTENVEILARLPQKSSLTYAYDDFAMVTDCSGGFQSSFIATQNSTLTRVHSSGSQVTILGESNCCLLNSPTSVAITADNKKLYITTGSSSEASLGGQYSN
ncbi:uncharacterized protein B0J16DRAFT_373000 [Fusarium flagelliforme]|uniref:uncharacterized protein n=1 Tax=Fusarium flagelliforme TaxID=2675880 RepID=UPI001E8D05E3|nr:uncharacterized protein B0J16DRAFT_373000 [Fusarium flagelliforme]KAH7182348.1 hypothetical protein B0J16DRAFT_373000 [Fusarium flagelliforme]